MTYQMYLDDSEVARIERGTSEITVYLSAAQVQRQGERGIGYLNGVSMVITGVMESSIDAGSFGRIREANLHVSGIARRAQDLPATLTAPIQLTLLFANGATFRCQASGVSLRISEDSEFFESHHC